MKKQVLVTVDRGETRVAMLVNLLGYWCLGLPVSYLYGIRWGRGPVALWWGLVLGLAVVATVLLIRVRLALAREQRRVVIDDPATLRSYGSPMEARAD